MKVQSAWRFGFKSDLFRFGPRLGGLIFSAEQSESRPPPIFRFGSSLFLGGSFARGTFVLFLRTRNPPGSVGGFSLWQSVRPPFRARNGLPSKAVVTKKRHRRSPATWMRLAGFVFSPTL